MYTITASYQRSPCCLDSEHCCSNSSSIPTHHTTSMSRQFIVLDIQVFQIETFPKNIFQLINTSVGDYMSIQLCIASHCMLQYVFEEISNNMIMWQFRIICYIYVILVALSNTWGTCPYGAKPLAAIKHESA